MVHVLSVPLLDFLPPPPLVDIQDPSSDAYSLPKPPDVSTAPEQDAALPPSSLSDTRVLSPGPDEMQVPDLSNAIRINDPHHVYCGGFADIYRGEWRDTPGPGGDVKEERTQVCLFSVTA